MNSFPTILSLMDPVKASLSPISSSVIYGTIIPGVSTIYMSGSRLTLKPVYDLVIHGNVPVLAEDLFPSIYVEYDLNAFRIDDLPTLGIPLTIIHIPIVLYFGGDNSLTKFNILFTLCTSFTFIGKLFIPIELKSFIALSVNFLLHKSYLLNNIIRYLP